MRGQIDGPGRKSAGSRCLCHISMPFVANGEEMSRVEILRVAAGYNGRQDILREERPRSVGKYNRKSPSCNVCTLWIIIR
jgi:hypothetical protein